MTDAAAMTDHRVDDGNEPILRVENISKLFGGVHAVERCSLEVGRGSITGLIGPNGSGKTTRFNVLTGMTRSDDGTTYFLNRKINGLKPHAILNLGMSRTFQITRVFKKMTVMENLRVATTCGAGGEDILERAEKLRTLFNLWDLHDRYAEDLSYGQQKLLEFARALTPNPVMVMLDEPFAGVNRVMACKLVELIQRFQSQGTTFFLIDHEMKIVMDICEWIYVMDFGEVIAKGRPQVIREDPKVLEAYFGR
jgi:branched-chain amino acid transport system ATP-binding protein